MTSPFVAFGNKVSKAMLEKNDLDINVNAASQTRPGSIFEGPCSIKTPLKMIDKMGAFSYINGRGQFTDVSFGRYCSIAEKVSIGYPEHPTDWLSTSALQYIRPNWMSAHGDWQKAAHRTIQKTYIGNDVWIGAGAFLRTGISVGTGAIIGAQAVVTKDVPPYAVVVGNPGNIIKYRVPETLIEPLLESQWWQYSPSQLSSCPFDNIEKALRFIETIATAPPYEGPRLEITEHGGVLHLTTSETSIENLAPKA